MITLLINFPVIRLAQSANNDTGEIGLAGRFFPGPLIHDLIIWLRENVGEQTSTGFDLPVSGNGWRIYESIRPQLSRTQEDASDWPVQGIAQQCLEVDDDELAMLLKLSCLALSVWDANTSR